MAPTELAWRGSAFFPTVRQRMWADRGFFYGSDRDLRYVCADAAFYRLRVFVRPDDQTFTASATASAAADPAIRAVTSGQFFGLALSDYGFAGPKRVRWSGEVISDGQVLPGGDGTPADLRHYLNQWPGTGSPAIGFGQGDPSGALPPVQAAIGNLLPLVVDRQAAPAVLGDRYHAFAGIGKCVYGVAWAAGVVFFLVQLHHPTQVVGGLTVPALIDRLIATGVEEAVMGDGSNTVGLVVDGRADVEPLFYKNNSIPCGPMLRLHGFALLRSSTLRVNPSTTDRRFAAPLTIRGTAGQMRLAAPGMVLELSDLGKPDTGTGAGLLADLEVSLPMTFAAEEAPQPPSVPVTFVGTRSSARLAHTPEQTWDGTLIGQLTIYTSRGEVHLDAYWDLEDLP